MKKLLVVLMILFVGILLCGCTSQPATPPATVAPTAAPTAMVTTVVPTTVATNVTPAPVNTTAKPTATPTPEPSITLTFTQYSTIYPSENAIVKAGTKVIWVNENPTRSNSVKSTGTYEGLFSSGNLGYKQSFSYKFTKPGVYSWRSADYTPINGIITVQ